MSVLLLESVEPEQTVVQRGDPVTGIQRRLVFLWSLITHEVPEDGVVQELLVGLDLLRLKPRLLSRPPLRPLHLQDDIVDDVLARAVSIHRYVKQLGSIAP